MGQWWDNLVSAALRVKVMSSGQGPGAVSKGPQVLSSGMRTLSKDEAEGPSGLQRKLGAWDLTLLGIGASIGAGIFVVTGVAARGAGPGVALSFLLAGLASVVDALCYAELSARFPSLGSAYLYTYLTFSELPAFLVFSHLMFDYHIGAASIARSLAGYLAELLVRLVPPLAAWIPPWLAGSGMSLLGGVLSLNLLAPLVLAALTALLCQGVKESSLVNGAMTCTKVAIVLLVVVVGSTQVEPANWVPFAPLGYSAILTQASVVFFAYVGFDAVANTAEESRDPQRNLPIGIMASLAVCCVLYIAVSLVITGMVPYTQLDQAAPLSAAFALKGLSFVEGVINIGAVAGLTTTLLVGLYAQSRLYLGVGRDGLLPAGFFAAVHPGHHTPVKTQIWCGVVAGSLALLFDVSKLSHILSVGVLTAYSVVCACVVALRLDPHHRPPVVRLPGFASELTRHQESALCIGASAMMVFLGGLFLRWEHGVAGFVLCLLAAGAVVAPLFLRQVYLKTPGFACPLVPGLPLAGMAFNIYLLAQMHWEAYLRFVVVTTASLALYCLYGQYHGGAGTTSAKAYRIEDVGDEAEEGLMDESH